MIPAKKVFKVGDGQTEMGADYEADQMQQIHEAIGNAIYEQEVNLFNRLYYGDWPIDSSRRPR